MLDIQWSGESLLLPTAPLQLDASFGALPTSPIVTLQSPRAGGGAGEDTGTVPPLPSVAPAGLTWPPPGIIAARAQANRGCGGVHVPCLPGMPGMPGSLATAPIY